MDWEFLKAELERRMVAGGHNQLSLAKAAGLHETAVRDIIKGRAKQPRYDKLVALARVLNCTVAELTGSSSDTPIAADGRSNLAVLDALPDAMPSNYGARDLKVLGVAAGSPEGWFNFDEAEVVEVAFRPPELAGVRDAFAIYVSGDSMADFGLYSGTLLHIHPHRRPHAGQFVVLVKTNGEAFVKRLVARRNGTYLLAQSNPAGQFDVAEAEVRAVYAVVGATFV
jgi:phage repressor protein C with HTH and peptisase S24 domain